MLKSVKKIENMHFYNKLYIMNYCNIKLTILFYKFYYKNQTFKDKFKNTLPRNERNTALLVVMGRPDLRLNRWISDRNLI